MRQLIRRSAVFVSLSAGLVAMGGELYRTEFESDDGFVAGEGNWGGSGGWVGINASGGAQGIDSDIIPDGGLGQTAFIGYGQPVFDQLELLPTVFVGRWVGVDPGPGELPVVEVQTIIGIQDSTTAHPKRDSFFVSVWNAAGNLVAALRFSNQSKSYGIWRLDGTMIDPDGPEGPEEEVLWEEDTNVIFYRGQLHLVTLRVDLPNNRWSADLDGVPLFNDAVFHGGAGPVDFGSLGYEWLLSATKPNPADPEGPPIPNEMAHGDNWMMVADVIVRRTGRGVVPFRFSQFQCDESGAVLEWPGEIGFDYQVEYSADTSTWHTDLSNSSFTGITADAALNFTDASSTGIRFYRVIRSEAP